MSKENELIIGIDPGITGAVVLLDAGGGIRGVIDMPVQARPSKGQEVSPGVLFKELESVSRETGVVAFLEQVGAMPGGGKRKMGATGAFKFGDSFGCARTVVASLQIPCTRVTPQVWKRHFKLTRKEKDYARTLCIERWPGSADLFKLKKHIGRADAALIALYGLESCK